MKIIDIVDVDFTNYHKPSMFIIMPLCSFKCDKENNCLMCQNSSLVHEPTHEVKTSTLIERYVDNSITRAIVFGGLEPFDSSEELYEFIDLAREWYGVSDDIVIYTGYTEQELQNNKYFNYIIEYPNIIIKFGRFKPNQMPHYDEVLGINLVSDNQYAKRYN